MGRKRERVETLSFCFFFLSSSTSCFLFEFFPKRKKKERKIKDFPLPPEAARSILLQSQLTQKSVSNLTRDRSESGFDESRLVIALATRSVVAATSGAGWSESMIAVSSLRMKLLAHLLLRSSSAPVSRLEGSPAATLAASPTTIRSLPAYDSNGNVNPTSSIIASKNW